ncbi:hypothetical protein ACHAWF_016679 [Thalassiosira exigua]
MYRQQPQGHRSEWKDQPAPPPRPPPPSSAWPGHPYQHQHQGVHVPRVHRPPAPPPVHYPPHHQRRLPSQTVHRAPYYHGHVGSHSPAAPVGTRQVHHNHVRAPALVSPATQVAAPSPRSPKASTSSPRHDGRNNNHVTPGAPSANKSPGLAGATAAAAKSMPETAEAPHSPANMVTTKPPRPYTEYTMFYQLEREYILHRILTTEEEHAKNLATTNKPALFENDPLMPARYRSLPLRADWYISGKSKKPTKRKHRKSHGKIGFLELTRMIAARWAQVDDETRKYCKMMAAMELVKYKEDMESYNLYKERLSAIGEIPEDMKERMLKKKRAQEKKEASKKAKMDGASSPGGKKSAAPIIRADVVSSSVRIRATAGKARAPTKLEPIAHSSHESSSNLDTDMEQFISSLVRSPNRPSTSKVITPERLPKKRRLFRDRHSLPLNNGGHPSSVSQHSAAAAAAMQAPLKDDNDHIDGIKMAFSGIDENEIAREFSDQVASSVQPRPGTAVKAGEPSFDYWDALVESPNHQTDHI